MRILQLHKILPDHQQPSRQAAENREAFYSDTDDVGENQNVVALAPEPVVVEEKTVPVAVNAEAIRCFNPRREDRGTGCRLTFIDGGGFAVKETYDEVLQAVISA